MGINGLWDVLGEGEVWHVAKFAEKHFKDTGKPLRIAVDEATWRFTNLNPEQVARIQEGEPAANPVEKVILWRILRLWRLNIQLLFVYDGLRKPGKSRRTGRGGGKLDDDCVKLLHRMFRLLKVPFHQAPGEAEAECARLQRLGIVDAVWSDDGDSFMFGCTTLIKAHKVGGKRIDDHIRIYRSEAIAQKLDFDADSLVLFALLAGGDYDATGLKGCGPVSAARVCRRSSGLAKRIVNITPPELPAWRDELGKALRDQIPHDFPKMKVLDGYRKPAVSRDDQCHNLRGLQGGWVKEMDQAKLRIELRQFYNFTTREYLKHLGPVFLARKLANATTPFWRNENLNYAVQLKSNRRTKDENGNPTKCEVKIKYSAHELVDIDLSVQPSDEDWSAFAAKDGTPYDPRHRIECEMLECLLQHGLPPGSWNAPMTAKERKNQARQLDSNAAESGDDQAGMRYSEDEVLVGSSGNQDKNSSRAKDDSEKPASKKRGRLVKDPSQKTAPAKKRRKSDRPEPDEEQENRPPPTFKVLDIPEFKSSAHVVDLLDESEEDESHAPAAAVSSQLSRASQTNTSTSTKGPPKFRPLSPRRKDNEGNSKDPPAEPIPPPAKSKASTQKPRSRVSQGEKTGKSTAPKRRSKPVIADTTSKPLPGAASCSERTALKDDTSSSPDSAMLGLIPLPASQSTRMVSNPTKTITKPTTNAPGGSAATPVLSQPRTDDFIPGQTIDPAKLRELRLATLHGTITRTRTSAPSSTPPVRQSDKTGPTSVVIDLT